MFFIRYQTHLLQSVLLQLNNTRLRLGIFAYGLTTLEDERGPGLGFILCFVCAAVVHEGLPLFI